MEEPKDIKGMEMTQIRKEKNKEMKKAYEKWSEESR